MKSYQLPHILARGFITSACIILILTGTAKVISGFGGATVLKSTDPVIGLPFRTLFWVVGAIEIAAALLCLSRIRTRIQAGIVLWLATCFFLYRAGLFLVGYQQPCSCMGTLTGGLKISPKIADLIMKLLLTYLWIGGLIVSLKRSKGSEETMGSTIAGKDLSVL